MRQQAIQLVLSLVIVLTMVACGNSAGKNSIVQGVNVNQNVVDGDLFLDLEFDLAANGIALPTVSFPIMRNGSQKGEVSLIGGFEGQNQVVISMNLSEVINIPSAADARLPDGEPLPIAGISGSQVIAIPLGGGNKNLLYIAINQTTVLVGGSFTLKQLDGLGRSTAGINLFVPFRGNNVAGTAGFYTSVEPGKSGIGLFIDITNAIDKDLFLNVPTESRSLASLSDGEDGNEEDELSASASTAQFMAVQTGSDKQVEKFDKKLYRMSRRDTELDSVQ